jgi:hypothetical protein
VTTSRRRRLPVDDLLAAAVTATAVLLWGIALHLLGA